MKYSEISDSFAPSYPFKMGEPGQFLGNRVADETLQMNLQNQGYYLDSDLVQYMELDEFLDECDLRWVTYVPEKKSMNSGKFCPIFAGSLSIQLEFSFTG